jgi:hypothetical protein
MIPTCVLQATTQTNNIVNFESRLDAVDHGAELSAKSFATSNRVTKLDAVSHGVETCNLDAMNHDVDLHGPKLSLLCPEV